MGECDDDLARLEAPAATAATDPEGGAEYLFVYSHAPNIHL
jgi:hypothetical protein